MTDRKIVASINVQGSTSAENQVTQVLSLELTAKVSLPQQQQLVANLRLQLLWTHNGDKGKVTYEDREWLTYRQRISFFISPLHLIMKTPDPDLSHRYRLILPFPTYSADSDSHLAVPADLHLLVFVPGVQDVLSALEIKRLLVDPLHTEDPTQAHKVPVLAALLTD